MERVPIHLPARWPVPAWLLSAIFHTVCLILLAVCYRPGGSVMLAVAERPVSIVLTERPATTTPPPSDSQAASADAPAEAAEPAVDTLPTVALTADLTPRELALPSHREAAAIDPSALLPAPRTTLGAAGRVPSNLDPSAILAEEAERRRRQAALGPVTSVRLFGGAAARGRSFVFLIDRSKSMGGQGLGAMDAAEQELVQSLATLQPNHRFQVIAYHHQCTFLLERKLLPATPANLELIRGHLSNLASFGATEHEVALRAALYLKPDAIFLLTDGGDPALTSAQLKSISRRAAGRTSIHCIQFGFGPQRTEENFLTRLAAENNGGYAYVNMSRRNR